MTKGAEGLSGQRQAIILCPGSNDHGTGADLYVVIQFYRQDVVVMRQARHLARHSKARTELQCLDFATRAVRHLKCRSGNPYNFRCTTMPLLVLQWNFHRPQERAGPRLRHRPPQHVPAGGATRIAPESSSLRQTGSARATLARSGLPSPHDTFPLRRAHTLRLGLVCAGRRHEPSSKACEKGSRDRRRDVPSIYVAIRLTATVWAQKGLRARS